MYSSLNDIDRQEHEYDEGRWMEDNPIWQGVSNLVRADSMMIANDPRFFCGNVMDKRLSAFKVLTTVNSLMFGTALHQCFALKKDMQFHDWNDGLLVSVAMWQIVSFVLAVIIAIMCLLSLYIMAHQLFYTIRLVTAGPSGFDQAAIFYLTRSVTMWRHLSIKFLFNGLLMFLGLVSMQLLVKFYKDAEGMPEFDYKRVVVMNVVNGTSQQDAVVSFPIHQELNMTVHVGIGYVVMFVCFFTAVVMRIIRFQHLAVFEQNYSYCQQRTNPIQGHLRAMSTRAGPDIET